MEITLRNAELQDSKLIAEMLHKLAIEIGDADAYQGTKEAIAQYGFGPDRRFHCLIAETNNSVAGIETPETKVADIETSGIEAFDGKAASTAAIGFAIYFPTFSTTRGQPGIYLQDLWVAKSARKNGVANKLIQQVSKLGSAQWSATHLTLTVYNDNPKAMKFYHSMDFHIGEREKHACLDGSSFQVLIG